MKKLFNVPQNRAQVFENKSNSSYEFQPKLFLRYTEKDLAEFKEVVCSELSIATENYQLLNQTLARHSSNRVKTPGTFLLKEDDKRVYTYGELVMFTLQTGNYIKELEKALLRIEDKTFGICKITGKLIAKDYLKKAPVATTIYDLTTAEAN